MKPLPPLSTAEILRLRPDVKRPEPGLSPLGAFTEIEAANKSATLAEVLTILLRGSECSFRCLMCDLWKHTHAGVTPDGAIPAQIAHALHPYANASGQPSPAWIKLYNASNFFAPSNVPVSDLAQIASLLTDFERVVVENHPRILPATILGFRDALAGQLEVAMGLETAHPQTLAALNKNMSLDDFRYSCDWLLSRGIDVRCFVLLKPPGMNEQQAVEWCVRSVELAHALGVRHISIIPLRSGNGAIEYLDSRGLVAPPPAALLAQALAAVIDLPHSIVTADLWDWQRLPGACDAPGHAIRRRIEQMNATQKAAKPSQLNAALRFS